MFKIISKTKHTDDTSLRAVLDSSMTIVRNMYFLTAI
jgi:hypothetical protein